MFGPLMNERAIRTSEYQFLISFFSWLILKQILSSLINCFDSLQFLLNTLGGFPFSLWPLSSFRFPDVGIPGQVAGAEFGLAILFSSCCRQSLKLETTTNVVLFGFGGQLLGHQPVPMCCAGILSEVHIIQVLFLFWKQCQASLTNLISNNLVSPLYRRVN